MSSAPCATHPGAAAVFQCDGCGKLLCSECATASHALFLCKLCGERALPLTEAAPATVREQRTLDRASASVGYTFKDALAYPFRGSGAFMYVVALVGLLGLGFLRTYNITCFGMIFALVLTFMWMSLLIGIQFKIVKSTAEHENEVPNWPEYFSLWERLGEVLTFVAIVLLSYGPAIVWVVAFGLEGVLTTEPQLWFWLGFAACLWLGTALSVMAYGAAGVHWRTSALRLDHHLRGLVATGADAMKTTNFVFVLAVLVFVLRGALEDVPVVGSVAAGAVGIYWAFVQPHLSGLLFRRHAARLHEIYEGAPR